MTHTPPTPRRLVLLGSTGSIGVNTLKVVEHLNKDGHAIEVVGLAAGRGGDKLIEQARRFNVTTVAVADHAQREVISKQLPGVEVFAGDSAALKLVEQTHATDLSAAIVGSAGLPATIAGAQRGMRIGLANKETLVAAGELVTPIVKKHHATLLPVDSEHSAIFQCIASQAHDHPGKHVKRIVLTASGGPFRTATKEQMDSATVEQALKHPTWSMGPKITIDSATMMNKALEIIEAHWLFDLPPEKIDVIIHPQSIAHSFVEFDDNSILAQLGPPDMKTPIQYALTWPDRAPGCSDAMDWSKLSKLDFEQPDPRKFRSLKLAYDVIRAGGTAGAVFNAANEAAVAAFLDRKIRFGQITDLVADTLEKVEVKKVENLETILEADRTARAYVGSRVKA
ncbi:MAG: 1-deoxy-D-xylulose-5-phosphate reductoisomerase [Phycisphaera sp.]|nr:1-deoxy-D-xylulose-5-phosphate reductoisomerase [Phycisphaera sp.]